jgi:hypothetical protein
MKRSLLLVIGIILALTLVLLTGCPSGTTTVTQTQGATTKTATATTQITTTATTMPAPPTNATTYKPKPPVATTTPSTTETKTPLTMVTTPPAGPLVYVSVCVDAALILAAQPLSYTEGMTLEDVIIAAHETYYTGEGTGYDIGTGNSYSMYMVNKCWGITAVPYIILNDKPNSSGGAFEAVNTVQIAENDNVILCCYTSSGTNSASVTATKSGNSITLSVKLWLFNTSSFAYNNAAYKNAVVWDPATGKILGVTDDKGQITIEIPASGVLAIEGLAAINANSATGG